MFVKKLLPAILDGAVLSPTLATVLGCIFGLLVFVILNSLGAGLDPKVHWIVAIVVALLAAGGINFFLKPNAHVPSLHD